MSPTIHDELETRLRELFERQADALPVDGRAWDDPPLATVTTLAAPRKSRGPLAAVIATAAAVALVVGVVAIAPTRGVVVGGQPGVPTAVHFATKYVSLAAAGMSITANGHRFTAGGSTVDLNSDPGMPDKYTTIELVWSENGVEMRLNMYFTSDGRDWWASEIRTYDGRSPGDWIEYTGEHFRTPLGHAFTGDVALTATGANGSLQFSNLRLQPFLPPAACKNATTKFVLDPAYDHVKMPNSPTVGFGLGTTRLLDAATCTQVADVHRFVFDVAMTPTGVAGIDVGDNHLLNAQADIDPTQSLQLAPEHAGSASVRLTARDRSTGKLVAAVEIPVTVS